jgi:hypothetical protein
MELGMVCCCCYDVDDVVDLWIRVLIRGRELLIKGVNERDVFVGVWLGLDNTMVVSQHQEVFYT